MKDLVCTSNLMVDYIAVQNSFGSGSVFIIVVNVGLIGPTDMGI